MGSDLSIWYLSIHKQDYAITKDLTPLLSHAVANPSYSWGVIRKVSFPGVNMDIGHMRNLSWAKDNDEKKWIAYNRLRGQYMSALEHAIPERFFNDPVKDWGQVFHYKKINTNLRCQNCD